MWYNEKRIGCTSDWQERSIRTNRRWSDSIFRNMCFDNSMWQKPSQCLYVFWKKDNALSDPLDRDFLKPKRSRKWVVLLSNDSFLRAMTLVACRCWAVVHAGKQVSIYQDQNCFWTVWVCKPVLWRIAGRPTKSPSDWHHCPLAQWWQVKACPSLLCPANLEQQNFALNDTEMAIILDQKMQVDCSLFNARYWEGRDLCGWRMREPMIRQWSEAYRRETP